MTTLDPNLIGTLSIAGGLSVAMLLLGTRTKMLELRDGGHRCPSCRRFVKRGTVCPCSS
ncbi:MAG TPA: hypothetical protein VH306_07795 [Gaiellaceae bacterium]